MTDTPPKAAVAVADAPAPAAADNLSELSFVTEGGTRYSRRVNADRNRGTLNLFSHDTHQGHPKKVVIGLTNNYTEGDAFGHTVQRHDEWRWNPRHITTDRGYKHGVVTREVTSKEIEHALATTTDSRPLNPRQKFKKYNRVRTETIEVPVREEIVERQVEVPVPYPVPFAVEVPKPYPVEKLVPVPKVVERVEEVPVYIEKEVEVPVPYPVEKIVEVRVEVPVEKIVEVPVEKVIVKEVGKEIIVPGPERGFTVTKHHQVPLKHETIKEIPYPVIERSSHAVRDPEMMALVNRLQSELKVAYSEIDRLAGYQGNYASEYERGLTRTTGDEVDAKEGGWTSLRGDQYKYQTHGEKDWHYIGGPSGPAAAYPEDQNERRLITNALRTYEVHSPKGTRVSRNRPSSVTSSEIIRKRR